MSQSASIRFDESLLRRYGNRGPRYTSYPTALQFRDDFDAESYRAAASQSDESMCPLSLYVHVPFCEQLCYYCACNKIVTRNQQRVQRYLRCLYREIAFKAELFDSSRQVEQLHFGGGTPTYLDQQQLEDLMRELQEQFGFAAASNREFSIEVDPRTVTPHRVRQLAELGFNRLSLGIQDFDPAVQKAVNRIQSVSDVAALVEQARRSRFRSVSFDLIYGLPLQTLGRFEQTLDHVVRLRPDRLAVYNYAHLPQRFKGQRMIKDEDIPLPQERLEILHATIDRLQRAGYQYVGMDHFALPDDDLVTARWSGNLQRNFQGYSTHRHCDLVGLGVSAISAIANSYAQNLHSTSDYEAAIEDDLMPISKGLNLSKDDMIRADVIQLLMCYDAVQFAAVGDKYSIDFHDYFSGELESLRPLVDDGLVEITSMEIRITDKGRLLTRSVAMVFDRYLQADEQVGQYSKAI